VLPCNLQSLREQPETNSHIHPRCPSCAMGGRETGDLLICRVVTRECKRGKSLHNPLTYHRSFTSPPHQQNRIMQYGLNNPLRWFCQLVFPPWTSMLGWVHLLDHFSFIPFPSTSRSSLRHDPSRADPTPTRFTALRPTPFKPPMLQLPH
jgi:hypothetical protein